MLPESASGEATSLEIAGRLGLSSTAWSGAQGKEAVLGLLFSGERDGRGLARHAIRAVADPWEGVGRGRREAEAAPHTRAPAGEDKPLGGCRENKPAA